MSITIKSGEAISRSPINNSISKQMYSFSKAPRFTFIDPNIPKEKRFWKIKENIGKTDNYYDIPEFLSKRFTTMGSGKRVDFTLSQKGVNTKYYSNPTDFDPLHPHGPRFSFPKAGAVKREKKKKKEGEEDNGKDKDDDEVKYPPFYNYLKPFGWDAPKFTMRGRNEPKKEDTKKGKEGEKEEEKGDDKDEKKKLKNRKFSIPGPGQYPITVHINDKGKYPVSNISNVSSFKYIYSKEKELERKEKAKKRKEEEEEELKKQGLLPPPEVKPLIGKIFNSRFRSSNNGSMYGRYKESDTSKHYPGPGSYRLPSDFGQYLSKDADKYPTENVYPVKKIPFEEKAWRHNMKIIKDEPEEDKHSYLEPEDIEDKKPVDEKHDDEDKKDDDGIEKKEGEDAEKEDKEGEIEKEEEGNNDQEVGGHMEKEEQDDIKVDQKPQENKEEGEAKPEAKEEGEAKPEGEVQHEEKPEGESKPEGQQEGQPETKPEEQAGTKPEGETQAEGQGETKPEGEAPVEGQGEAKPEGEAPVEGQGEAKPEGEDGNGEEIVGGFMDEEEKDDVKPSDEANQG